MVVMEVMCEWWQTPTDAADIKHVGFSRLGSASGKGFITQLGTLLPFCLFVCLFDRERFTLKLLYCLMTTACSFNFYKF